MARVDGHILKDIKVTAVTPKLLHHFFRSLTKEKEGFEQALPVSTNRSPFRSPSSDTVTKAPRFFRHRRRFGAFARAVRGARVLPFLRKKTDRFRDLFFYGEGGI